MKKEGKLFTAGVSGLLFVILIVLVRCVDVAPIGPEGTSIGLSHINQAVFRLLGFHMTWYKITTVFGAVTILTALGFAAFGFLQLLRRRTMQKVDKELVALGGLYAVVLVLYILFEKVIINYRPVIMPGNDQPEASFPSTHTMLVCVVMGSAIMLLGRYIKDDRLCSVLRVICGLIIAVTVIGRLLSGVHWFTDILGGILISITLLAIFSWIIERYRQVK